MVLPKVADLRVHALKKSMLLNLNTVMRTEHVTGRGHTSSPGKKKRVTKLHVPATKPNQSCVHVNWKRRHFLTLSSGVSVSMENFCESHILSLSMKQAYKVYPLALPQDCRKCLIPEKYASVFPHDVQRIRKDSDTLIMAKQAMSDMFSG
eukprot:1157300-Pelagomonas_calceolata.AAC.1